MRAAKAGAKNNAGRMRKRCWRLPGIFAALLWALGPAGPAQCAPPPANLPKVLLAAPVNATFAANQLEHWSTLGFDGFLLEGVVTNLADQRTIVATPDGAPPPDTRPLAELDARAEAPVVQELRLAHRRLAEVGLRHTYLRVAVSPEEAWFTDSALTRQALAVFRQAGALCRLAGLAGLALDTQSTSLMYDFRWDGYDLESASAAAVRNGARGLGRRALRTFIRECPETHLLVIADAPEEAGPLWFDFFTGVVESLGAAEDIHIDLCIRACAGYTAPRELAAALARWDHLIRLRLPEELVPVWRSQCGFAPMLAPLGPGVAHHPPEVFRTQLAAAKCLAPRAVCIAAPEGGWWEASGFDAFAYDESGQRGPGAVRPIPPPVDNLAEYAVTTPLDGLRRAGPLAPAENGAFPGYVFLWKEQAAILAWDGTSALAPEDGDWVIVERSLPAVVVDMQTGTSTWAEPRENRVTIPRTETPTLLKGLAFRDWVLPAALWLEATEPFEAGGQSSALAFGFVNHAILPFDGVLELSAPPRYGLGETLFDIHLEPGESLRYERLVQGVFEAGARPEFSLSLVPDGGGAVQQRYAFDVGPEVLWTGLLDGPVAGVAAAGSAGGGAVVAVSRRGDVSCYEPDGVLRWRRRFKARFDVPPLLLEGKSGAWAVALADHRGRLRMLDSAGGLVRALNLGAAPAEQAFAVFAGHTPDEIRLVAGLRNGHVWGVSASGDHAWEYVTGGDSVRSLAAGPDVFVVTGGETARLLCLDAEGELRWERALEGPAPGPGCLAVLPGGQVAAATGTRVHVYGATGDLVKEVRVAGAGRARHLSTAPILSGPEPALMVAAGNGLVCVSPAGDTLWRAETGPVHMSAGLELDGLPFVLAAGRDGVCLVGHNGAVRWRSGRTEPASGPPVAAGPREGGPYAVWGSSLGAVRCLRLAPRRQQLPETP